MQLFDRELAQALVVLQLAFVGIDIRIYPSTLQLTNVTMKQRKRYSYSLHPYQVLQESGNFTKSWDDI